MKITIENAKTLFDEIKKSKVERKGYIMLPSVEGFLLYEIDEEHLRMYLQNESLIRSVKEHKTKNNEKTKWRTEKRGSKSSKNSHD